MKTYVYKDLVVKENLTEIVNKFAKEKPGEFDAICRMYAFRIQAEAAANAPVDMGTLKNSIEAVKNKEKELSWIVQDGVYYGIFQELGTSKGVSAKHFLGGATERNSDPFIQQIVRALT